MKAAILLLTSAWMASANHQAPNNKAAADKAGKAAACKGGSNCGDFLSNLKGKLSGLGNGLGGKVCGDKAAAAGKGGTKGGCGDMNLLGGLKDKLSALGHDAKCGLGNLKDRLSGLSLCSSKAACGKGGDGKGGNKAQDPGKGGKKAQDPGKGSKAQDPGKGGKAQDGNKGSNKGTKADAATVPGTPAVLANPF